LSLPRNLLVARASRAKRFDDEQIPSTYLSLTAGLVYGLTDQEGAVVCEQMRKVILQKYTGTAHCVAPSGAEASATADCHI
jgi:hypothetical protein